MLNSRCSKQQISWTEHLPSITANVLARACNDKIDFITSMRLLWICSTWSIDLHEQAAMLKHCGKALTVKTRQAQECLFHGCLITRVVGFHCLTSQGDGRRGCFTSYCLISSVKTA